MDWVAIGSFLAGLVGGYTIKAAVDVRVNKRSTQAAAKASGNSVSQSGNFAGVNRPGFAGGCLV